MVSKIFQDYSLDAQTLNWYIWRMDAHSERRFLSHFGEYGFSFLPVGFSRTVRSESISSTVRSTSRTISGGKISLSTSLSDFRFFGVRFFIGD